MDREQLTEEALAKALQWVEATEQFVAQQAPLLVEEIVWWGWISYMLGMAIGALLIALGWLGFYIARRAWVWGEKREDEDGCLTDSQEFRVFSCFFGGMLGGGLMNGIGFTMFCTNLSGVLYVAAAPRLYVIEQLGRLIN